MEQNSLIQVAISRCSMIIIKATSVMRILICVICSILYHLADEEYTYHGVDYIVIIFIILLVLQIIIEFTCLWLFVSGLNNTAHYFISNAWRNRERT